MTALSPDQTTSDDANPLVTLLRECVVPIYGDGEFRGTGFLVAPGEVLTCAHVVHRVSELTVEWEGVGLSASVVKALPALEADDPTARFYPLPDVALLRLVNPPADHPCVRLDPTEPVTGPEPDVLRLDGYTVGEHGPSAVVHSSATLEFEGPFQEGSWRLFKLKGGQVIGGYSGGPLLNTRTGGVCGLVDSSRGERSDLGGFGVPMSAFLDAFDGLRERNKAYHGADGRWAHAIETEHRQVAVRAGDWDRLPLLEPLVELNWNPEDPPSDLLRPRYGVVPFIGREQLLDHLMLWREADDRVAVVVLAGAGGFGKTRTAIEVCGQAQRAGWSAGLLGGIDPTDRQGWSQALDELAAWPGRLLVAVDYAETRPDLVAGLLHRLYRRPGRPPTRVVLVVRQALTKRQLEDLFATGDARDELAGMLRRAELVRLDRAEHELDRAELFEQALAAFVGRVGSVRPTAPMPRLRAELFGRPLLVLAAALLVAWVPGTDVGALSDDELAEEVLNRHEARYWNHWNQRLGLGLDPVDQRRLVAVAALLGAATEEEASTLVRLVPGFAEGDDERVRAIARWLSRLYGSGRLDARPAISPLEPDILAEVLIASELVALPELIGQALDVASEHQLARALVVLSRAAAGRDQLTEASRAVLDERLPGLVRRLGVPEDGDAELLAGIRLALQSIRPFIGAITALGELPEASITLAPLAADVTAVAVDALRTAASRDPDRYLPDLAGALNNLSVRLSDLGRTQEGLGAIQEAVQLRRTLAEANPDRYLPNLATAINNLSVRLSELGRPAEALSSNLEAVTHYRTLAEANPDRYLPDLAGALSNLSNRLSDLGRTQEGLGAIQEAVTHYRALAEANPDRYLPDLAMALNNLSNPLSDLGRTQEGLGAIQEAVTHYRTLAEANPDRYLPDLASALNTLSNPLSDLGRTPEALGANQEAVQLRRTLAEANPDRHLFDLASALNNLSIRLRDLGRTQEGLGAIQEAVQLRRTLAEANPDRHLPDLADSLNNLSVYLSDLGRTQEGLGAIQEAVTHYRTLAEANPDRYLPDLAMALNNLSNPLSDLGRTPEAARRFAEILDEYADDTWATGVLLLSRASWHRNNSDLTAAIGDAWDAVRRLGEGNDALRLGNARSFLRSLRTADTAVFDRAWTEKTGVEQPLWLRLYEHDERLSDQLIEWIGTTTWEDSQSFLVARGGELLTDQAQAALEYLIDANPGRPELMQHLRILLAARSHGIEAAYRELHESLLRQSLTEQMISWIGTRSWDESRSFLEEHGADLLTDEVEDVLQTLADQNPEVLDLVTHLGLLALCRIDGIEGAYALLEDQERLRTPIDELVAHDHPRQVLAVARLRAGLQPDDGEAHLAHAVAALAAGRPEEADRAILRSADALASWERSAYAKRLSEMASSSPDVAQALTRLQARLTNPPAPPA